MKRFATWLASSAKEFRSRAGYLPSWATAWPTAGGELGKRQEVAENDWDQTCIDAKIEENLMLFELVEELPSDQCLVICRRFIDQKSLKEIAQELCRSEGAIKQLQFRALQSLRTRIRSRYV
jgi:RNA polymerase sigma factor (sigma-70 family)